MKESVIIKINPLPHHQGLPLPAYQSAEAAGMDLAAAITDEMILQPQQRALIATGIALELPAGFEAQIRPRSGMAINSGVTVLNTPGTIDSDYRGEIKVILINLGNEPFVISRGMRIAQMVIAPVLQAQITVCGDLGDSERGDGGFGHSGS